MDSETTPETPPKDAREQERERRHQHYIANKAAINARNRAYYAANHDAVKASARRYYRKNAEKIKAYQREYNATHAEKVAARHSAYEKIYRAKNRARINARVNAYRAAHPEKRAAQFRAYFDANKSRIYETKRKWRKSRPDLVNAQAKRTHHRRWKTQPSYRILLNLRNRLQVVLKTNTKSDCTRTLIGTTPDNLRQHLESQFLPGMSWSNYGPKGWHIDHIVPCAAFDLSDPKQQARCFHWSNLRPLWAKANIKKSDKTDGQFQLPLSQIAMEA